MNRTSEQASNQRISFQAKRVSYEESNGGDVTQVIFSAETSNIRDDARIPTKPYFLISICYEVSKRPSIEWFDGTEFYGGSSVIEYFLNEKKIEIFLKNGVSFSIAHACPKKKMEKINDFLMTVIPNRKLE